MAACGTEEEGRCETGAQQVSQSAQWTEKARSRISLPVQHRRGGTRPPSHAASREGTSRAPVQRRGAGRSTGGVHPIHGAACGRRAGEAFSRDTVDVARGTYKGEHSIVFLPIHSMFQRERSFLSLPLAQHMMNSAAYRDDCMRAFQCILQRFFKSLETNSVTLSSRKTTKQPRASEISLLCSILH